MKTFLKITVLLGLLVSLCCLTSCGKDDDDDNYAAEVAGTYIGQDTGSDVKKYSPTKAIGASVIITRESNNRVKVEYDNAGTKSTATIYTSALVTKGNDGTYNISYDDKYIDIQIRGIVNGNSLTLQRINYGTVEVNFLGYR